VINIRIDVPIEIHRLALLRLGKDLAEAGKYILQALATAAKKRVQRNMGGYLGAGSGWLNRHVYGVRRSPTHFVVAAPRHIAEPLERGAVIFPKKGKLLAIGGRQGDVSGYAKKVVIPAKHWFTKSYDGFEDSDDYKEGVDKGIARAVKKFGSDAVTGVP
jgi:hypothetical protein